MNAITGNIYTGLTAEAALEMLPRALPETGLAIVYPGDSALLNRLYKALSDVSNHSSCHFFFVLPGAVPITAQTVSEAGRFFFLANYLHTEGSAPRLLLIQNAPEDNVALFEQWCSEQGFSRPEVLVMDSFKGQPAATGRYLWVRREEQDQYFEYFTSPADVMKWVQQPAVMEVRSADEALALQERWQATGTAIQEQAPDLYALLQALAALEEERRRDKAVLKFLREEVQNLRVFNKEILAAGETEKILKFYHTQYEVLPLWYKRFGHIIKIIMGKRKLSFTSNKEER